MADDIVFCAKTGRRIITSSDATSSNVIPFPAPRAARPQPEIADDYVEQLHIRCSANLDDIDNAAQAEIDAMLQRTAFQDDDI